MSGKDYNDMHLDCRIHLDWPPSTLLLFVGLSSPSTQRSVCGEQCGVGHEGGGCGLHAWAAIILLWSLTGDLLSSLACNDAPVLHEQCHVCCSPLEGCNPGSVVG